MHQPVDSTEDIKADRQGEPVNRNGTGLLWQDQSAACRGQAKLRRVNPSERDSDLTGFPTQIYCLEANPVLVLPASICAFGITQQAFCLLGEGRFLKGSVLPRKLNRPPKRSGQVPLMRPIP